MTTGANLIRHAAWGGDDEAGRQAGAVADALREAERRIRASASVSIPTEGQDV